MAGFQQAANTITGAPARFNIQKSIVEELQRDLAGEQATNLAYRQATAIFERQAAGYAATPQQVEDFKQTLTQVPVANREMFTRSASAVEGMSEKVRDQRATIRNQAERIYRAHQAVINKKSMSKALWGKSAEEIRADAKSGMYAQAVKEVKEEMKSGTTQTSR